MLKKSIYISTKIGFLDSSQPNYRQSLFLFILAVVHNTPVVAAQIASDDVTARGVTAVPAYDSVLGYVYGVNGHGLRYDRFGLYYGYCGLGCCYGGALGYTGFFGSYRGIYA
ncbi:hypothetical protein AVEN_66938-1 [Araneus ventricosus]|uniref:Uncharacterized protein n=1 Tax=Araneus ventricosus TaxID=182803 RepID=A0A4Y2NN21_ARAVE|nr:hypothetical protein AVEN_66938-1 [Araneus ventricosus]